MQNAVGMRIQPAPSEPSASGRSPAAAPAAASELELLGVIVAFHGSRVRPVTGLRPRAFQSKPGGVPVLPTTHGARILQLVRTNVCLHVGNAMLEDERPGHGPDILRAGPGPGSAPGCREDRRGVGSLITIASARPASLIASVARDCALRVDDGLDALDAVLVLPPSARRVTGPWSGSTGAVRRRAYSREIGGVHWIGFAMMLGLGGRSSAERSSGEVSMCRRSRVLRMIPGARSRRHRGVNAIRGLTTRGRPMPYSMHS